MEPLKSLEDWGRGRDGCLIGLQIPKTFLGLAVRAISILHRCHGLADGDPVWIGRGKSGE